MRKYKFVDRDFTRCRLVEGGEKVDIKLNEVVESNLPPSYFTKNGFIEVKMEDKPKKKKLKD